MAGLLTAGLFRFICHLSLITDTLIIPTRNVKKHSAPSPSVHGSQQPLSFIFFHICSLHVENMILQIPLLNRPLLATDVPVLLKTLLHVVFDGCVILHAVEAPPFASWIFPGAPRAERMMIPGPGVEQPSLGAVVHIRIQPSVHPF
ncbi:hypothetical protein P7K49_002018 [Saguinus oedipus]|uniref:Secreted protein n=1 Tax=Saguinus oedipus TaxID=9490 RepID=A0ABQ9WG59_SAGOE|nr:hypothetical protein P7K49_002018 [Saguinus oedipus]